MVWAFEKNSVLLAVFALILWYLRYLWGRRKLYFYSWNMPGPLGVPLVGTAYKFLGNPDAILEKIMALNEAYSSPWKMWFGPRLFVCLHDPEQVEKVLTKCINKDCLYNFMSDVVGTGLFTAHDQKWRKHRRLIAPAFNQKILDSFVEVFVEQAYVFTDVLENYVGHQDFDISKPVAALLMDIICETAMGLKMDTQRTENKFALHVNMLKEMITLRMFRVWHHLRFTWSLYPLSREFNKHVTSFHEVTLKVIKEKKKIHEEEKQKAKNSDVVAEIEEGTRKKNLAFMDLLLHNSEFTEEEIREEVETFLVAGTDTSEIALCFLLEMIGMFPEIQQKIYEEVVEILGEDRPVEAPDLPHFKYMERVIKESLRLFPVGPYFVRIVEEDIDLGKYILPEGSSVFFSMINIHRDARYWPDPLKFDPDRFLPEEVTKRSTCCYFPFAYGPRNCIGSKFAMMSLKAIVATVIRKYRVFTRYKSVEEIKLKVKILLHAKYGHKVYLELR